jgi:hypothetical protein
MRHRSRLAVVVAAAVLAGCGGSGDSTSGSTLTQSGSTEPAVSSAPGGSTVTGSTDVPYDGPVYPLTGLPALDPVAAARPALVVKIDNNEKARPQSGLNAADIVFEEIVEVQTRFAAVFHSRGADPVGPIRSGRTQDIDLLGSLSQPLFMWSGGNDAVTAAIEDSDLINLSALKNSIYDAVGFFRADDREGPHDLYGTTTGAWTLAPDGAVPPQQQFQYRGQFEAAVGEVAAGCTGDMDGLQVEWRYDGNSGLYARTTDGVVHEDALSGPITTNNVIVMVVEYLPSPADPRSPEAQTIGSGEVLVFTGGVLVRGTWSRADRLSPVVLTASDGSPILLAPGRTWVELSKPDRFQTLI